MADHLNKKPVRSRLPYTESPFPRSKRPDMYKTDTTKLIYGGESHSNYVDVISVGPIGGVKEMYLDKTPLSSGEFPKSVIFAHDGRGPESPWEGDFPWAERTTRIGKQAELVEKNQQYHPTTFIRKVTSVGVRGIRLNFTSGAFTQRDNKNRRKSALAGFQVDLLDDSGRVVKSATTGGNTSYYSPNPVAMQLQLDVPQAYWGKVWEYRVTMFVMGHKDGMPASGNWTCSTVTELYLDTQTYDNVAFSSGTIVASDFSGSIPGREYLADGYEVLVPVYQTIGQNRFALTGRWERATSDSHAWNAMAVLTDDKWGGKLELDKINLVSFNEFHKYCMDRLSGDQRFDCSLYMVKADNYYKIAQQIVGAADGKLYEDSSGRIAVMIDRAIDNRRVITSYDIVDESVKRDLVPDNKKINYVEAQYDDKDNEYEKNIIHVEDSSAITRHGVISKKIKLDTCTKDSEAKRVIKKLLAVSQVNVGTSAFEVGPSHEDIQIGEIVEIYDRKYANMNYCGKTAAGSTKKVIQIDPRTPIDLTGLTGTLELRIDNNRGLPIVHEIESWTGNSITLTGAGLAATPESFTSFGILERGDNGLKPQWFKVMGVKSTEKGTYQVEAVSYNHSVYAHVDTGSALKTYKHRHIPAEAQSIIQNLTLARRSAGGLSVSWDSLGAGFEYGYNLKFRDLLNKVTYLESKVTSNTSLTFTDPVQEGTYEFQVLAVKDGEAKGDYTTKTLQIGHSIGGSSLPQTKNFQVDGTASAYTGRSFTLTWEQDVPSGETLRGFILTLQQGPTRVTKRPEAGDRSYRFSENELKSAFGDNFGRSFTATITAVDGDLNTTSPKSISPSNTAPQRPTITVDRGGNLTIGSGASAIPDDVIGMVAYIWLASAGQTRPGSAARYETSEKTLVLLPDELVKVDGTAYRVEMAFIDTFGETGSLTTTIDYSFNIDALIPVQPELEEKVIPLTETSVIVNFTHDGYGLNKVVGYYRQLGGTGWTKVLPEFDIPVPTDPPSTNRASEFDPNTEAGFFKISGLDRNFQYEFKATAKNKNSTESDDSNIVVGQPYLDVLDTVDIEPDLADARDLIAEGVTDVFKDLEESLTNLDQTKETDEVKRQINTLESENASIRETLQVVTGGSASSAAAVLALTAKVNQNEANLTSLSQTVATDKTATSQQISALTARVGSNESGLASANTAIANETSARTSAVQTLTAAANKNKADIASANTAIANETSARSTAVTTLTAGVNKNKADIATANTAIADETSARSTQYTAIKAASDKNAADIVKANSAIASETSARASAVSTLTAATNKNKSDISSANSAITTERNARVSAINTLTAKANGNTASITAANKAISDETSARASADSTLSARISSNTSTIATVDNNAKAAIGYCTISGNISSHGTKAACQSAGGSWTNSALADAVRRVQVTSGGKTATVGSFYQAYVGLDGAIRGKAVMGVASDGRFTGMQVVGGSSISRLTFRGDLIRFQNASGVNQMIYNNSTGTWDFKGTVRADKLIGEAASGGITKIKTTTTGNTLRSASGPRFKVNQQAFPTKVIYNFEIRSDRAMDVVISTSVSRQGSGVLTPTHTKRLRLPGGNVRVFTHNIVGEIPAGNSQGWISTFVKAVAGNSGTITVDVQDVAVQLLMESNLISDF